MKHLLVCLLWPVAKYRIVALMTAWTIALLSMTIPDDISLRMPSLTSLILLAGAICSVLLSFFWIVDDPEPSVFPSLAVAMALITATAAAVTYSTIGGVSIVRIGVFIICGVWQLFSIVMEVSTLISEQYVAERVGAALRGTSGATLRKRLLDAGISQVFFEESKSKNEIERFTINEF